MLAFYDGQCPLFFLGEAARAYDLAALKYDCSLTHINFPLHSCALAEGSSWLTLSLGPISASLTRLTSTPQRNLDHWSKKLVPCHFENFGSLEAEIGCLLDTMRLEWVQSEHS
ncbi:uncharacterized protein [Malus domestica]|uniref:uncharacterized protein n=1 Tax=Malus domestica TaxID=3750 RepID=UPI0039757EF9